MEKDENTFQYNYSAKQQEEIKNIRKKYLPPEENKMEQLRKLDQSATRPGMLVSICVGTISSLIMGIGMCCTMLWADKWFVQGIIIGVIGIFGIIAAYPLYVSITKKKRQELAPEILKITEELMK